LIAVAEVVDADVSELVSSYKALASFVPSLKSDDLAPISVAVGTACRGALLDIAEEEEKGIKSSGKGSDLPGLYNGAVEDMVKSRFICCTFETREAVCSLSSPLTHKTVGETPANAS